MSDCQHNAPEREPNAGDVQTQGQQLDEQTREMLLDKLTDSFFCEGDPDIEAIEKCLAELEAAGVECEAVDVEQGLKNFHERFAPLFENDVKLVAEKKKPSRFRRSLARIAIIAAALCAFVFTAQASGLDIIGAIARWTSEQFSFVKVDEEKDERMEGLSYTSLDAALIDAGITEQLGPAWFPEGTELKELRVKEDTGIIGFFASYAVDNEEFFISIRSANVTPYGEIEINDPNVKVYTVNDVEHHIMTDVEQVKATWNNGSWECFIAGNLDEETLVLMIDSIYE